jgi:hypothetical protein
MPVTLPTEISNAIPSDPASGLLSGAHAQPAKPSASILASYFGPTCAPGVSVGFTLAQSSGLMTTIQPAPYGSSLASVGFATSSSFTATTSPPAADFAGPTHLPDSTVAHDLPACTARPTFFGVNATSCPAIAVATVVMPILMLPSSSSFSQMWLSTS